MVAKKFNFNKKLNKKEKREIAFILSSVLVVTIVLVWLSFLAPAQPFKEAKVGAAVSLDADYPTYAGVLYLMKNMCSWVESSGSSCDDVCEGLGEVCIPLEESCNVGFAGDCRCCDYPE